MKESNIAFNQIEEALTNLVIEANFSKKNISGENFDIGNFMCVNVLSPDGSDPYQNAPLKRKECSSETEVSRYLQASLIV